jgi:hypothetical protein
LRPVLVAKQGAAPREAGLIQVTDLPSATETILAARAS